ncbi:MAG: hypothetical protein MK105_10660 [Crocinitomicaceae bacterium]|nr:hypothetical protein [Crocinitomicaceae bacterium]
MKLGITLLILLFSLVSFSQLSDEEARLVAKRQKVNRKYIGNYELPGKSARITMKEEGRLWVFVPGMPESMLEFIAPNTYSIAEIPNYELEFTLWEDGTVKSLIFKQPNKTVNARKKD